MKTRIALLIASAISVLLTGCAKVQPQPFAWTDPAIALDDAGSWRAARVVPDERPIELLGEFTAQGREALEHARSAQISRRHSTGLTPLTDAQIGAHVGACIVSVVGIVACPLGYALGSAVHGTANGVRHLKASARAPKLLIPERHAYSLARTFKENATGAVLAARTSRYTIGQDDAGAQGRLVVRMKAVETSQDRRTFLGIRLIAEAQAHASDGVALAPTEHVYTWAYGPLSGWSDAEDELVRQALEAGLDALAASIGSTYASRP